MRNWCEKGTTPRATLTKMAIDSIQHTFFDIDVEHVDGAGELHLIKILSIDGRRFTYEQVSAILARIGVRLDGMARRARTLERAPERVAATACLHFLGVERTADVDKLRRAVSLLAIIKIRMLHLLQQSTSWTKEIAGFFRNSCSA